MSGVLRRLLVEHAYEQAWRATGLDGQPMISAPAIEDYLGQADRSKVEIVCLGNVQFQTGKTSGLIILHGDEDRLRPQIQSALRSVAGPFPPTSTRHACS